MNDHNPEMNDKDIRDLLKWRLLEQVDDDLLTQKLTDMEATLAFTSEALHAPSLQKEKELFEKLNRSVTISSRKWALPFALLAGVLAVVFYMWSPVPPSSHTPGKPIAFSGRGALPVIQADSVQPAESAAVIAGSIVVKRTDERDPDTLRKEAPDHFLVADPGISVNYAPGKEKYDPKFVDAYENIPVLTEKEKAWTKKNKEKLVKAIMKRDKQLLVYVPMSTDVIYGDTVSMNGFYMFSQEITNNTYHTFLNDLIMQDKIDDFIKAVPDTAKWLNSGNSYEEPMRKNYYWHPAYNDYPVVTVTREGAKMFCDWLTIAVNEKTKSAYSKDKQDSPYINDLRIPAEEEWLIAARGGHGDIPYPWSFLPGRPGVQNGRGCYLCNFSIINYPDSLKQKCECANKDVKHPITSAGTASNDFYCTARVNSYNPNDFGLYCICGNVAEMVWQYKTRRPCAKGGSWNSSAEQVKINAAPELIGVTEGSPYLGFRPVFTATRVKK
jgi:formylglycine-generating enzyme required for sulfatase activity